MFETLTVLREEQSLKAEFPIFIRDCGSEILSSSLLFVKASHPRRGVARKLFAVAKMSCKEENKKKVGKAFITVNASPYAVEVYKKLGFSRLSEEQIKDGIRFTPMSYPL